jgi:hypothetical protein
LYYRNTLRNSLELCKRLDNVGTITAPIYSLGAIPGRNT